ncbi:MAG: hypothetical protein PHH40_03775 [Candidatus Moranbacteria bacterium]|nr:hypothetical protein [Candidatus Moranbacteria bacterium]MDD3964636.1 hypothetical protein [Candidatus Moranbacteria bacterium]
MSKSSVLFLGVFSSAFLLFILIPLWNEEKLKTALDPLFMEFQNITSEKYPFKEDKEIAFQEVLDEKARIVEKETLAFISCEATFITHNPGSIYRKDAQTISCSWGR